VRGLWQGLVALLELLEPAQALRALLLAVQN